MTSGKFGRLKELYNDGGIDEIIRGIRDYTYYTVTNTIMPQKTYRERRADINDRWEFIAPFVDESTALLDIGCAEGYYTTKAAEAGAFAIGIDIRAERLENARQKNGYADRVGFLKWGTNPENIDKIPKMDVILLLTVQHHWEEAFGIDAAEQMFQHVMDKSNILIYEPPGDRPIIKSEGGSIDHNQSIEFYRARLEALYGDSINILDETLTEFRTDKKKHLERKDPLFAIDTSEFSIDRQSENDES